MPKTNWKRGLFSIILLICLTVSPPAQANSGIHDTLNEVSTNSREISPSVITSSSGLTMAQDAESSLVFTLDLPPYTIRELQSNQGTCVVIEMEGYSQSGKAGEAQLPFIGTTVGIPLGSTPDIWVLEEETFVLPGSYRLCPAAKPAVRQDGQGAVEMAGQVLDEDPDFYSQDLFWPAAPANILSGGMIRSQRVLQVGFSPFSYNPARGELRAAKHLKVELSLGPSYDTSRNQVADEGAFEETLRAVVSNYDQARAWRAQPKPSVPEAALDYHAGEDSIKIEVAQDGIYLITYAALSEAGAPVDTLDPHTFHLTNQGVAVPMIVTGEGDGVFNPVDTLVFYGQKTTSKYTYSNIYWLTWGSGNGLRMGTLDGNPSGSGSRPDSFLSTLHLEQNLLYMINNPSGAQMDHWYWNFLNASSAPISYNYEFQLQNLASGSFSAKLRGLLKGYSASPQHHTRVYINGILANDQTWPSTSDFAFAVDVDQSVLVEGTNTITVELPRDGGITIDQVLVNWFELDYYHTFTAEDGSLVFGVEQAGRWEFQVGNFSGNDIRVLDITNPRVPMQIAGGLVETVGAAYQITFEQQIDSARRYIALESSRFLSPTSVVKDTPSTLKSIANGADYLVISHRDFLSSIQPLAAYRASQGLRVAVVDVQDIYDEFNWGIFDPQAIQSFLAYAYANWARPAPVYVLLVGDGHYDFKDYYGGSGANYLPPFLGEFDPWVGETASDNRYVMVSGSDILPDMHIGRFPVNSAAEADAMVAKVLSYEQDPAEGGWNTKLTFVADNADGGGDFVYYSNHIADNYTRFDSRIEKIYYNVTHTTIASTQQAILDAINQGRLIINYTGHASINLWASEKLFQTSSVPGLSNTGKYPFFVAMTCQEGYFIKPNAAAQNYPSVAETVVRASQKGAIASYSPTGYGLASGHDILSQGLYLALFRDHATLGAAVTASKVYLLTNGPSYTDLIDTYMLFGDPALRLKEPPYQVFFPLMEK